MQIGAFVVEKFGKKVNLREPDMTIYVNIAEKEAYIYLHKEQ